MPRFSTLFAGFLTVLVSLNAIIADEMTFTEVSESATIEFSPAANEDAVPPHFRLKPHRFEAEAEFLRETVTLRRYSVTFPSPVESELSENNTVYAEYFQPAGPGPFPGVVVLHILGGEFPLSQTVASALARAKVAALFVKMPYYGERRSKDSPRRMISRNPRETAEGMTQAVLDIRRAGAWLAARPEVDKQRLGVTGISLGGIMSALSAAGEPRFRKVAIYLGGGKLGENLWGMEHRDAEAFRSEWLKAGESRDSFLKLLEPVDPATHGRLLRDRDVLMVNAKTDEIIPHAATMALWDSIGTKPELVWLDAGHITAAAYLPGEMVRLQKFFTAWKP
ncbi:MAG: alpha/beta hydrolase family protein [Planctomycetaceae bacterium]